MIKTTDLQGILRVLNRRKFYILLTFVAIFLSVSALTMLLPPVYKSTATILIEAQNIPENFVQTAVTGYVEERLQAISHVVLGRESLIGLIERFDLFRKERGERPMDDVVAAMKRNILVETIQANVVNPRSGRATTATVAFNISYKGKDPDQVASVVNEITSLFLRENTQNREQKARKAVDFLEDQARELRRQIQEKEQAIAEFRRKHLTMMPEMVNMNMQTADRLDKDIAILEEQLRTLQNRSVYLQGQLATVDPGLYGTDSRGQRMTSPSAELDALRREYVSMRATYSENHPDVQRIKSRIAALEETYGSGSNVSAIYQLVNAKEDELDQLMKRYSESHPDVVALKREIATLRQQAAAQEKRSSVRKVVERQPDNPAYINIKTQIASTEMEIVETRKSIVKLKSMHEEYRSRLEQTPGVEQEFRILRLDYDNTQEKYRETISRLQAAKEAMVLEESHMAEKMTLISPATVPETPDSPNRVAMFLAGIVLALGGGIGVGSMAEFMDRTVHTMSEVARIGSFHLLGGIPYLTTPRERRVKRQKRISYALGGVLGFILIVLIVHLFVYPLDGLLTQSGIPE
jgi:polysaccharide biosynthesis transport protein